MLTIDPKEVPVSTFHGYLLGAVAPRPIAFASTIDKDGNVNLSPFSYFNVFGSNPATLVFSPTTRVRDNTNKHTLENVLEHDEVVINIVNYKMVAQMSLTSTEYDKGVNEFLKSGLTELASVKVKPPRVAESPASFECKVKQIIRMGNEGGAANLVICEVVLAHFKEEILNENQQIDPYKLDAVARMGGNWYCRAQGDAIFKLERPSRDKGIGVDSIPEKIRLSKILSGNDLGKLGNINKIPNEQEVEDFRSAPEIVDIYKRFRNDPESLEYQLHNLAKAYIKIGETKTAWLILLLN
jgi:flavin reductase (DIM6/NTAB) family NADH-FMN oxidoreductase RutF